jgi:hypothetical protein
MNSHVPFAWQVYFWTPIAWTTRNSRLSGANVCGSSKSPGAGCGAGRVVAAAALKVILLSQVFEPQQPNEFPAQAASPATRTQRPGPRGPQLFFVNDPG